MQMKSNQNSEPIGQPRKNRSKCATLIPSHISSVSCSSHPVTLVSGNDSVGVPPPTCELSSGMLSSPCQDANNLNSVSPYLPMSHKNAAKSSCSTQMERNLLRSNPPTSDSPNEFIYQIKWINFEGKSRQNEKGPLYYFHS